MAADPLENTCFEEVTAGSQILTLAASQKRLGGENAVLFWLVGKTLCITLIQ